MVPAKKVFNEIGESDECAKLDGLKLVLLILPRHPSTTWAWPAGVALSSGAAAGRPSRYSQLNMATALSNLLREKKLREEVSQVLLPQKFPELEVLAAKPLLHPQ